MSRDTTNLDDLMKPRAFAKRYPDLITEGGLRWMIFNAANNGLLEHGAVIRFGRSVYIDAPRFRDCLTAHRVRQTGRAL